MLSGVAIGIVIWVLFGTFVCKKVLSGRAMMRAGDALMNSDNGKREYAAFARKDSEELPSLPILILRAYTLGTFFVFISMLAVLAAGVCSMILPPALLSQAVVFVCKTLLWTSGITVKERGNRAKLSEAPCVVANHNSAFDIIVLLTKKFCFVSHDGVRDIPIVGKVAKAIGCIFVLRDSKDSRGIAKQKIAERLDSQVKGTCPVRVPLVVFPEGSTTNGHALLVFRRGAFESNVPIQPVFIEFSNHMRHFTIISLSELCCLACTLPGTEVTLHWRPVIKPSTSRDADATASLARESIAAAASAYGRPKLELLDASVSHRDAVASANLIRRIVNGKQTSKTE